MLSPCRLDDEFESANVIGNSSGTIILRLLMYWASFLLFQLSPSAGNCDRASLEGEKANILFVKEESDKQER